MDVVPGRTSRMRQVVVPKAGGSESRPTEANVRDGVRNPDPKLDNQNFTLAAGSPNQPGRPLTAHSGGLRSARARDAVRGTAESLPRRSAGRRCLDQFRGSG